VFGNGEIFDRCVYANAQQRNFYERFRRGETVKAGWVKDSDFEQEPVE